MGSLGWGGKWDPFGMLPNSFNSRNPRRRINRGSKASNSGNVASGTSYRFPFRQAATAGSLALTGDTISQLRQRWIKHKDNIPDNPMEVVATLLSEHDWIRAVRLTSYAFLVHGPMTYAWYQFLDRKMPTKTAQTLLAKNMLTHILIGPTVTAIVFAWNNLWQGKKISELPHIYRNDAIPALLFGYRFWIPVTLFNFWLIPLQFRVAYMCSGGIFWNFYLSSTLNK